MNNQHVQANHTARPQRVANHNFKVGPNYLLLFVAVYVAISNLGLLFLPVIAIPLGIARGDEIEEIIAVALISLLAVGLAILVLALGIALFVRWYQVFEVADRQVTVRKMFRKNTYDCSEIASILCVKAGYSYRNVIVIGYKDGKNCRVDCGAENRARLAAYLLDMLAAGIIQSNVIEPEHVHRLKISASGRKW